jgi:hypothetical protein
MGPLEEYRREASLRARNPGDAVNLANGTRVAASRLIRRTHRDSRCTFAWSPSRHDSRNSRYSR